MEVDLLAIMAPPSPPAVLPSKMELTTVMFPLLSIAPPFLDALLFVNTEFFICRYPPLSIAPAP